MAKLVCTLSLPGLALAAVIASTCLTWLAEGKIPPTLPVCPEVEELKVLECQRRLNASLVSSLPPSRAFYTGVMQPTELSRVCKIITHYSACDTNALGFCRRVRPTPPPTDYFFMSLANFCYTGAFNDYPTLFLCYQSASRQTTGCFNQFKISSSSQRQLRRDAFCRLYSALIDCVTAEIKTFCGAEAVQLVEPLMELSVTESVYCTSNKLIKYVVGSVQADQLVGSPGRDAEAAAADQYVASDASRSTAATSTAGGLALCFSAFLLSRIN